MQKMMIARISTWVIWALFTLFYIGPRHLRDAQEEAYRVSGSLMDWISKHHEGLILLVWGIATLAILIDILLRSSKEHDAKMKAEAMHKREAENKKL